jgi:hypothetical protein
LYNIIIITPFKASKRVLKAADLISLNTLINIIILGEKEAVLALILSLNPILIIKRIIKFSYLFKPLILNDTKANNNINIKVKKEKLI